MKTITLTAPWSFHSVPVTIDFPAGVHEVEDHIHAAALAAGVHQEEGDAGAAKARPARAARPAEG